jgi:Tfp pilus assembly protein PilN
MIQFNLLPDVKIAFIKAQRQKRLIVSISIIAGIAAIAIFILLFTFVNLAQKKNMNDLTKDIKTQNQELTQTEDLNKILSVQNQLKALDQLHGDKIVASRLFSYLQQVTPTQAAISELEIDFEANTMSITGTATSVAAINAYTDSLKFTNYTTENDNDKKPAFNSVVLSSFARSENKNSYTITLNFDPVIFSQDESVKLQIPQIVSSRSNTERPSALFQQNIGEGQ